MTESNERAESKSRMRRTRANGEQSRERILDAATEVATERGYDGTTISLVSKKSGLPPTSIYWHFADMAAYKAALVSAWAQWRDDDHRRFAELETLAPRDRLIKMTAFLISPRQWMLERAMREWARSDRAAARSVKAADRRARAAVRQAFLDLGLSEAVAEQRSQWLFAIGIGALHLSNAKSPRIPLAQREELVDFLIRP